MQISVLGPLEVWDDDADPIEVAGARLRALLSRLALDGGRPVGVEVLVSAVWGDRPPVEEANALQTLVSRLRRALGKTGLIVQSSAGYRLALDPADVDVHRFEQLATEGADALSRGQHAKAAALLTDALQLWRGPVVAELGATSDAWEPELGQEIGRLTSRRNVAIADRIEADLAMIERGAGRAGVEPSVLVAELEALTSANPLNERVIALRIRALARAGRQADALQVYQQVRTTLAEELGVDPSQQLQDVHLGLLRGEYGPTPPPPPAPTRRTNLTAQLTSFVGRDLEVGSIGKVLEQNRLVTLVGPGGAGKTRLASEAAARVLDVAPDGVWLVELAPVSTATDVPGIVLTALGLRALHLNELHAPISSRDAMTRLIDGLADRQLVLVLDNCEHLIEATARLADRLLAHCPGLRILTTSREPLGIVGEVVLAVPPLGWPARTAGATEALEYPAVRLFAERAAAVSSGFEVDDAAVGTVIEIVSRLDGLPLAIELAAARLRTMPLGEIATRLSDRFRLLTGGSRTALPRHRTLRAVVDWSWDLLTPLERSLAEQLAVFPAGVTATSAAAVGQLGRADVTDLLASLADKSLLQPVDGARRMRMLETIREYGVERLVERGELATVRARHATHFAATVADSGPSLFRVEQLPTFALFTDERDNILAAMRYLGDCGDVDAALSIAVSLATYAMMTGAHVELSGWLSDALSFPGGSDPQLRLVCQALRALNFAVSGAPTDAGYGDEARPQLDVLARQVQDVDPAYSPLVPLLPAVLAFSAGLAEECQHYLAADPHADAMADADRADPWTVAALAMFRAMVAENEGDLDGMRLHTLSALEQFRALGERWGLASTLRSLGQLCSLDGDLDGAVEAYREVMQLYRELRSREDEGFLLGRLADLELRRGEVDAARRYLVQAHGSAEEHGELMESIFTASMLGAVEYLAGNHDTARDLQRDAARRLGELPPQHPAFEHVRSLVLAADARLRAQDGDLDGARQSGREALSAAVGTRDRPVLAAVGVVLALLAVAGGQPEQAAEVLGATARLRGADDLTDRNIVDLSHRLRAELGTEPFERCYATGKALGADAAIERLTAVCA